MIFTVSNAHHTFGDKICFVVIIAICRASVGAPFSSCCVLLGGLFEVLFLTTFQGNRVSAGNSGRSERKCVWGCGVPKTITSMPSLRARADPEQTPRTQGPQGPVDKSLRQIYRTTTT